ncbi:MAG TPA: hypothetical protein VF037_09730 [Gemmatimonadales bacterium]
MPLRRLAVGLFLGLGGVPPLAAQMVPATPIAAGTRLSCPESAALLADRAATEVPAPVYAIATRNDADDVLRTLTDLALGANRCSAALGIRGLVKWGLASTSWTPKDAPGQRAGIPWDADAIYDLTLAAEAGGATAAAAGAIAVGLLLDDGAEAPWLIREVGHRLLAGLAAPGAIPDSMRQLQRGRLAAWLWEPATADSAFTAYRAAGGDPDRSALELARVRLGLARADGEDLYYLAAASADSAVVAGLRADLALIADSAELAAYDALAAATRAAWLREFWEARDLESLKARGSRLSAHYQRIGDARRRFRILTYPRRYELDELWVNRDAEFDDRGLIFIRHGMPDDTASAVRAGSCPNTSWLYRRSDGNLIFHFLARENPDDWRLVETLANVSGGAGATTRVRQAGPSHSCGAVEGLLESRASLDPIYGRLAVSGSRMNWERELRMTTRSREIGTATDSDALRYPHVLDVAWRAYGLLGSGSRGRILLLVSIPGSALTRISDNPIGYGFAMRVVAQSDGRLVEIDTLRRLGVRQEPGPGEMLTFTTELPIDPGTWRLGVAIEQPVDSSGQFFRDGDVSVPAAGGRLSLSDIVLGAAQGGRPWQAPDGPFPLSATGSYRRGSGIPIYYEMAGAGAGSEVETEIAFMPEEEGQGATVTFTERAGSAVERVRRELGTDRLKPGRYQMRMTIRTAGGESATRETSVYILDD